MKRSRYQPTTRLVWKLVGVTIASFAVLNLTSAATAQDPSTTTSTPPPPPDYDLEDISTSEPETPADGDLVDEPVDEGNGDNGGDTEESSDPSASQEPDPCSVMEVPTNIEWRYERLEEEAGEPPDEDSVLFAEYCENPLRDVMGGSLQNPFWAQPPEAEDEGLIEQALLEDLYAQVSGNLPNPIVSTNPGDGQASIVNVPTFVAVENWPSGGEITDEEGDCDTDGAVCVIVTAEPNLVFDPGEPDAASVDCQGPGVPYDPDHWNDDPYAQAGWDETCTHTYTLRTGIDDRPDRWDAQVEIRWTITGYRGTTGATEELDGVTTSTPLPREVNPINAVVTD